MSSMWGLSIEWGDRTERHELPEDGGVVLGSGAHCDVVVDDDSVAVEHACFELGGEGVRVATASPGAELLFEGEVVDAAELGDGDCLTIGSVCIRAVEREADGRLRGLDGFRDAEADAAQDAVDAAPLVAEEGRLRIVLEDLDEAVDDLEMLPGAARPLRRLLEIAKRLARAADEAAWRAALLDAALVLVGGDRATLLGRTDGGEPDVLAARDTAGDDVTAEDLDPLPDEVADVLAGGRSAVVRDDDGKVRGVSVALGVEPAAALLVESLHESDVHGAAELDLARALADQALLALERVRLRGRLDRSESELAEAGARAERLNHRLADLLQRRTLELRETRAELARRDAAEGFGNQFDEIVGRGPAMLDVLRQVDRVARTTVPVLFEGESGTGKELLARALHASSDRAGERFVAENCAALPDTLLENELFGHERGAFTGAETSAMGLFERADGGTLFLDEVGDMSPNLQTRLLRVLQEGEVRRVGGSTVTHVDVRVVAATNRNLREMVREGRFREDLYYRLAVVKIRVPPLRERREDVPALVGHFLRLFSDDGLPLQATDEALDALLRHDWPGNIRELQNEVRRAAALSRGLIDVDVLSPEVRESRPGIADILRDPVTHLDGRDLRSLVEELELRVLRAVLEREHGNITRTAAALGLSRLGLRKKMQRYGLSREDVLAGPGRRTQVHPS
jgi:DNA-binding NtrC family response regulator